MQYFHSETKALQCAFVGYQQLAVRNKRRPRGAGGNAPFTRRVSNNCFPSQSSKHVLNHSDFRGRLLPSHPPPPRSGTGHVSWISLTIVQQFHRVRMGSRVQLVLLFDQRGGVLAGRFELQLDGAVVVVFVWRHGHARRSLSAAAAAAAAVNRTRKQ